MGKKHVLIVDDEKDIAGLLAIYFENAGYTATQCYDAASTLKWLKHSVPDVAILDVMLPDLNGFELCEKIRLKHQFPIIMLTAKIEDQDKIIGLTKGADDYITKPFNPMELLARVKAQLRRAKDYNAPQTATKPTIFYEIRGLYINKDKHLCTLYGQEVALTPIEFSILWHLCENQDKVVSSEALFEAVWQEKYMNSNNTVMAHIARLREKLNEPPRNPKFIQTVWGVGYKIES